MNNGMTINVSLTLDNKVAVRLFQGDKQLGWIELDAKGVSQFIQHLQNAESKLK